MRDSRFPGASFDAWLTTPPPLDEERPEDLDAEEERQYEDEEDRAGASS